METKRVVIASDPSGFHLKEAVKAHLQKLGYPVTDVGQYDRGIVICGTGAGVSLIANKFKGVHCVACESVFTAERCSLINNANVLAMGETVVSAVMGCEMAEKWLANNWCEGFAEERRARNENGFAMLCRIEDENFR